MSDFRSFSDFDLSLSDQQIKQNEDLIESLKQNRTLQMWMKEKEIPLSFLMSHPYKISAWAKELEPCQSCKGLAFCKHQNKGFIDDLKFDGILMNELTPCSYAKEKQQALAHKANYLSCDLSDQQLLAQFEKIDLDKEDNNYQKVFGIAMQAAMCGKGLYLCGTLGTGKTYLATCACNYYAKKGEKVAFVHYPSFVQRMVSQIDNGEYRTEFQRLCYAKFLVLDDIGAESVTEWNRDQILLPILNHRYEENLPTWFTSNEDLDSLLMHFRFTNKGKSEEVKALRILERIRMLSQTQTLTGKDRRKFQ